MGVFDIENNIIKVPLKGFVKLLPIYTRGLIPRHGYWFYDAEDNYAHAPIIFHCVRAVFGEDFADSVYKFIDDFENIQIDSTNSILEQIEIELKQRFANVKLATCKLFLSFSTADRTYLEHVYNSYLIRHKIQQRGYETDPYYLGYIKTEFTIEVEGTESQYTWYFPITGAQK